MEKLIMMSNKEKEEIVKKFEEEQKDVEKLYKNFINNLKAVKKGKSKGKK